MSRICSINNSNARVYPKFCVNSKAGAKAKVDRGGGQGTLFAALAAM